MLPDARAEATGREMQFCMSEALAARARAAGRGVPQDYEQAHQWYNLAVAQGLENAGKSRDIVAKNMTPAQIA